MGLKILHSADWHLDSPFGGFSQDQRAWLKGELLKIPDKIADICRREGCDLVLLAGDLFDGPYTKESARAAYRAMESCGVPVFIAPGNHDFLSPESPWLAEPWPENVHIFSRGLSSVSLESLDCRIYGGGYETMDCPGLLEGFRPEGEETYQIGILHGDPMQIHSPYCPVTAAQVRDSGLQYLALGHIHRRDSFRAGRTLCAWPGCPMGRGFDEQREKGVYIVTVEEQATCRFVELDGPRFYTLEGEEQQLDSLLPPVGNDWFYRFTLTGEENTPLFELCRKLERFPNLELTDRREEPKDPFATAGEDTLEGIYFRLLQQRLEQASPEEAETIRLAARITRKLLDGKAVNLP